MKNEAANKSKIGDQVDSQKYTKEKHLQTIKLGWG
jgi:hypothetical protein